MTDAQQIHHEIEHTRANLSENVDRLTEKVSPPRIIGRQVNRVKSGTASVRDRVMGSAGDGSGLRGAGDTLSSAADSAKEAISSSPDAVRTRTQGNPLGAGLVAFGLGMVISSLIPATDAEQRLAASAEDKAKDLAEPVKDAGRQLAEDLKPAAQDAVEQVKSTAQDATQRTGEQAKSAAYDVKAPLQQ